MNDPVRTQLIGAWRLISFESRDEGGGVSYSLGKDAIGQISYGPEGRMSVLLVRPDRLPFASADMRRGTDA